MGLATMKPQLGYSKQQVRIMKRNYYSFIIARAVEIVNQENIRFV